MTCEFKPSVSIPIEIYPKPNEFVDEASSIVEDAERRGIILRVMGGLAIYLLIRGSEYENLWRSLGRLGERVFTDVDLAAYSRDRNKIINYLTKDRDPIYLLWQPSLMYYGNQRLIFYGCPEGYTYGGKKVGRIPMVEVFLDALRMNHTIPFRGRLELGKVTLTPTDLLLEKLQIVKINEKDIKDAIILFLAFDLSNSDVNAINSDYIAKILSDDWGFYYTFTNNLMKIRDFLKQKYSDILSGQAVNTVIDRIDRLYRIIEDYPKTMKWRMRAKIGTKKKWYDDVEELIR